MSTIEDLETWKSNIPGRVVVSKRGEYGVEKDEMIQGGKTLHITASDRRMNQERAATPDMDVFTNGMLVPLRVGDSAEEFASNPNLISEDDMRALVKIHPTTFKKRLEEIKNPVVIAKIREIAEEEDVSLKRMETIEERMAELETVRVIKTKSSPIES